MKSVPVKKKVNLKKRYVFPDCLYEISYKGRTIVVSRETANWIVLENEDQVAFYKLLKKYDIGESLNRFQGCVEDARSVVTQLEARHFEDRMIRHYNFEFTMHLYLTNACNLRCPHCYMSAGTVLEDELSKEEVELLLMEFASHGGNRLVLSGGEVCMRNDLIEIVKCAKKHNLNTSILTNGTLWTERMIEQVVHHVDRIQISVDGYSEETNALVRGRGNFEKALWAVDKFARSGIFTEVAITPLYRETIESEIAQYADFGKMLMKKYAKYHFDVKFTGEILDGRNQKLLNNQKLKYLKFAEKVFIGCYGDISSIPFVKAHRNKELSENCNYGNLSVSATGEVYLCAALPNLTSVGNIRNSSFSRFVQLRKIAFEKSNVNNLIPCRECALKYICGGECRVTHFKEFIESKVESITNYPVRECNDKTKSKYLDLMLRTNKSLYQ